MKPTDDQVAEALRTIEIRLSNGAVDVNHEKIREELERIRVFNRNWDQDLVFYFEKFAEWMREIPAIYTKPLPFPHPCHDHRKDDWHHFLSQQRRISGQEAAYLTNSIRAEKKINQQIVVSRMWLLTALTYEGKIGSEGFWDTVLDEVVRELPNWTVEQDGDRIPPDTKTLRNMLNIRLHKRFLQKTIGVKISRDG